MQALAPAHTYRTLCSANRLQAAYPASWRQAAARGLLARATRVELPHEHSAAAADPEHGQAAAGAQAGSNPEALALTAPSIHAPIRVEPARGCVTTLEAIARCACSFRVEGGHMVRTFLSLHGKGFMWQSRLQLPLIVIVPWWGSRCDAAVCVHMHTGRQDKGVELTFMPWREYEMHHILLIIESCWGPYAPFRVSAGPWLCWRAMQGWRRCFWRRCGA